MDYQVFLGKSQKEAYDITQCVGTTSVTDCINKAGSCSFTMAVADVRPEVGNAVQVIYNGTTYFAGYIFKTEHSQDRTIKVTACDQLVYLKTSDTKCYSNLSLDKIVSDLCSEYQLRPGELEPTDYPLGRLLYDGKQLLDIIANCITLTLRGTGEMYYIKDDGGHVVLRSIRSDICRVVIEPGSLLSGYSYSQSIEESANQIKLVRDNKETGKRELFVAKDSRNIARWGLLQHYEKLDDGINAAQAKEKADMLLELKNRVAQALSLNVVGTRSVRAGSLICTRIPDIELDKFLLCTGVQHSFDNAGHTAKVDLRLV